MTHLPVLLKEVLAALQPHPGGRYLDATVGGGGHSRAILEASAPTGRVLATDADRSALAVATAALAGYGQRVVLRQCWLDQAAEVAQAEGFLPLDGILVDLGVSSNQLEDADRGLSFMKEGPLDMRYDRSAGLTASELIENADVDELTAILRDYGEVPSARRIAQAIWAARPVRTTAELRAIVERSDRGPRRTGRRLKRIHPATQVFQALRIAVNEELRRLTEALPRLIDILAEGGRLAVISFHSLEDRIVKNCFRNAAAAAPGPQLGFGVTLLRRPARVRLLTRNPIHPGPDEVAANPRARSARLRVVERIDVQLGEGDDGL